MCSYTCSPHGSIESKSTAVPGYKHYVSGACPGFLEGGSNISWFPKKGHQILKGGGGPMV